MFDKKPGRPRKETPKGISPKASVVLPPEDMGRLKQIAQERGVNMSILLRDIVELYLRPQGQK